MLNIKAVKSETANMNNSIPELVQLQQLQTQKIETNSTTGVIILQNIKHKQKEKRLEIERHFQILEFYNDNYKINIMSLFGNFIYPKYVELATIKDLNKNPA